MKTIEITLYQFSELSAESKEFALTSLWDINVEYDWWNSTYEDAKNVGIKITGFDMDSPTCDAKFIHSAEDTILSLLSEHGETCETYKTALKYKETLFPLYEKDNEKDELEIENEEYNFLLQIRKDFLKILREEYDYLISEKARIDTFESNEYWFDENGKLWNGQIE